MSIGWNRAVSVKSARSSSGGEGGCGVEPPSLVVCRKCFLKVGGCRKGRSVEKCCKKMSH